MISHLLLFLSAAIVSLLITYPIVWLLKLYHLTQFIREEGPQTHKLKAGTPIMGGIGLVLTMIAFALIFIDVELYPLYLALILLIAGFALSGLADDLIKIFRQKNLGLTFWQKISLQVLLAGLFSAFLVSLNHQQTVGEALRTLGFAKPIFYFLFSIFVIVGTANATNLTDGLNGLLAGTAGIAFLGFAFLSSKLFFPDGATFSFAAAGAILAFLIFNFPRAKAFMGDVGSLAIGAALAGLAIIIHKELHLMLIGGIFLAEALSVILQVVSYKLFKRRIFKMTPLHHHFELMGYKEIPIVIGFWIAGGILGLIGFLV